MPVQHKREKIKSFFLQDKFPEVFYHRGNVAFGLPVPGDKCCRYVTWFKRCRCRDCYEGWRQIVCKLFEPGGQGVKFQASNNK